MALVAGEQQHLQRNNEKEVTLDMQVPVPSELPSAGPAVISSIFHIHNASVNKCRAN